jgi:hypothetical protein
VRIRSRWKQSKKAKIPGFFSTSSRRRAPPPSDQIEMIEGSMPLRWTAAFSEVMTRWRFKATLAPHASHLLFDPI